eukprot:TRINITY_DN3728_c0_g1_i1.p1 TRINITY_DN3728_c0_g1~~TRINITY_DN3728_c0_g1_i1.p1  ORF type:complete len:123 (+),score=21.60 TRINITY_DN3728_c0_g1_i1:266-634(+)
MIRDTEILILDSLSSYPKKSICKTIRSYLKSEWEEKDHLRPEKEFTKIEFPERVLDVPKQENYYDCGVFVLKFAKLFCEEILNTDELSSNLFYTSEDHVVSQSTKLTPSSTQKNSPKKKSTR